MQSAGVAPSPYCDATGRDVSFAIRGAIAISEIIIFEFDKHRSSSEAPQILEIGDHPRQRRMRGVGETSVSGEGVCIMRRTTLRAPDELHALHCATSIVRHRRWNTTPQAPPLLRRSDRHLVCHSSTSQSFTGILRGGREQYLQLRNRQIRPSGETRIGDESVGGIPC
jgi:hypothetical protein